MYLKRSAKPQPSSQATSDSVDGYKHPVFENDQRSEAINRLLGENSLAIENELELGYDPNESAIRKLRY